MNTRYLFSIPARIEPQHHQEILGCALALGSRKGGLEGSAAPCWAALPVTDVATSSIPPGVQAWLEQNPDNRVTWTYLSRLDPDLEWRWLDHEASHLLRRLLEPWQGLFRKITRVKIFVQLPGQRIEPHRDLVAGHRYEHMMDPESAAPGPVPAVYLGRAWMADLLPGPERTIHHEQGYLSLKIPISERPGDPGRPYVVAGPERVVFSSDDHLYFMNEYEVLHGAEVAEFHRGVVFVDGIHAPEAMRAVERQPVRVLSRRADGRGEVS